MKVERKSALAQGHTWTTILTNNHCNIRTKHHDCVSCSPCFFLLFVFFILSNRIRKTEKCWITCDSSENEACCFISQKRRNGVNMMNTYWFSIVFNHFEPFIHYYHLFVMANYPFYGIIILLFAKFRFQMW